MAIVKRLHIFILKSFLPLFAMTFFIVLFIVLMQFLWRYIDDLVGKGLSFEVLAELFFYAAVSMVPMALPLAILLASLMTFGNLGEKFELTAMKASGISLLRVMAPLIVLISGISVGAFFFQNDVLPKAQVKMWTLLLSMKQKSPEVEIPEGVFYDQIPGYNLFVQKKNQETGMLHGVMIYDVSKGGDNASIILADSARIAFTNDNRYLYLHMHKGEQFENLRERGSATNYVPFRREQFFDKEVLIPFDANFNRMDDQQMRKQYVGKNIAELRQTIDSIGENVDSMGQVYSKQLIRSSENGGASAMGIAVAPKKDKRNVQTQLPPLDFDSLLKAQPSDRIERIFATARGNIRNSRMEYEFRAQTMADEKKSIRRHEIELLKKFTLSVACLIFFFIGAPLGAIIRKGGIGTPLVISVLLFLVYYIIDNTGYKMARDGRWVVWIGMWMSTFILAPLGIYVTYKAMNDSAVFDKDAYVNRLRRWLGIPAGRRITVKEVIINDISTAHAIEMLQDLKQRAETWLARYRRPLGYFSYFAKGYDPAALSALSAHLEETVAYLHDSRNVKVVNKLSDYPVMHSEWFYRPGINKAFRYGLTWFFPLGVVVWLISMARYRRLRRELRRIDTLTAAILDLL